MRTSIKRDNILEAANQLFERNGFHATGVDQLAAAAGVTKRTLYKHFSSKEGLIEAVLQEHHTTMMAHTRKTVMALPAEGDARIMACFELYREWFTRPTFSGCIFIKTLNEFGNCSPGLVTIARESKTAVRNFLIEITEQAGIHPATSLADQLQLLLEGSIVLAQSGRGPTIIDSAKAIARDLITHAQKQS
jgi:AcrR family transcriptional regulator